MRPSPLLVCLAIAFLLSIVRHVDRKSTLHTASPHDGSLKDDEEVDDIESSVPLRNGCAGGVCDVCAVFLWLEPSRIPTPVPYVSVMVEALGRTQGTQFHHVTVLSVGVHSLELRKLEDSIRTAIVSSQEWRKYSSVTAVTVTNIPLLENADKEKMLSRALDTIPYVLSNESHCTHIFVTTVQHVPMETTFFTRLSAPFIDAAVLVSGCSIFLNDQSYVHGYGARRSRGDEIVLVPLQSGYSYSDSRVNTQSVVLAVSPRCMLLRRTAYTTTEKFENRGLGEEHDALMWMASLPNGSVVASTAHVDWLEDNPSSPTYPITLNHVAVPSKDIEVVWALYCCHCCGFSNEAAHLIYPLEKYVRVRTTADLDCHCNGFPKSMTEFIQRAWINPEIYVPETHQSTVIWVSHGDPFYITGSQWGPSVRLDYVVGRVMYEFTKIPNRWIRECNRADIDELWVPSEFVRKIFVHSGVDENKLVILPEGLDTYYYDPKAQPKIDLEGDLMSRFRLVFCNRPITPGMNNYKFLSVFKWEDRKGWDVLVDAYFNTFQDTSKVTLYIFTHIWYPGAPNEWGPSRDPEYVARLIYQHLEKVNRGYRNESLPTCVIVCDRLSEEDVATIFNSVDAFVLPTRGEGWGLPIMQAMSMGLPTIATSWGGQTDFMPPDVTYLIDVDSVEDIPTNSYYEYEPGKKWAMPSATHLGVLLQQVMDDPIEAKRRGELARQHIVKYYDDEVVAKLYYERVKQIAAIVETRKRRGYVRPEVPTLAPGESLTPVPTKGENTLHAVSPSKTSWLFDGRGRPTFPVVVMLFAVSFLGTLKFVLRIVDHRRFQKVISPGKRQR